MAVDMFMKLTGIDGEATNPKHTDEIQVDSFSFGEAVPRAEAFALNRVRSAGKVNFQDFSFTTKINKSSPVLMQACAMGDPIQEGLLSISMRGADFDYMKIVFEHIILSSVNPSGNSLSEDLPMEQVSFAFQKIRFDYVYVDPTGQVGETFHGGWDIKKNEKL